MRNYKKLFSSSKATYSFSFFRDQLRYFVICILNNLTTKDDWQLVPQVIYFFNKCETMFSIERLKIFNYTCINSSTYLKLTKLASKVKPSTVQDSPYGSRA